MTVQPVLIDGQWVQSQSVGVFQAEDPARCEALPETYPISSWTDVDLALDAAMRAFQVMRCMPADQIATFLEEYAGRIESRCDELSEIAHRETALPISPRLADVELPRTTNQLRLAAQAARDGSWCMATIDTAAGIRSHYGPLGPVCVFGPNNFPFAFGSISGGDFAAAMAAGNPVLAKANSSHPGTTRLFAEEAELARQQCGLPAGCVQLLYRTGHEDGERLVADPRVGAIGYTGSRSAGLKLKAAADAVGKPIYLELSSVNPVVILPGALSERAAAIAEEFTTSCLMGTGQFCTNPGMLLLLESNETEAFVQDVAARFSKAPVGTLLSRGVQSSLSGAWSLLQQVGAEVLVGGALGGGQGYCCANTLLRVSGTRFLEHPNALQTEAFGNSSLVVIAEDLAQLNSILGQLEGNLTGCIYSDTQGSDDDAYRQIAAQLRLCVGRLLNDKMPTGVAVSPAMNHGGPFPATGHPGFTAVGIPASLARFGMLHCYDNVRPDRLPKCLQDANPTGSTWRWIDGTWTQDDLSGPK